MLGGGLPAGALAQAPVSAPRPGQDRAYMAGLLQKIAEPVLSSMARGALKREFDMELSPVWDGRDRPGNNSRWRWAECVNKPARRAVTAKFSRRPRAHWWISLRHNSRLASTPQPKRAARKP